MIPNPPLEDLVAGLTENPKKSKKLYYHLQRSQRPIVQQAKQQGFDFNPTPVVLDATTAALDCRIPQCPWRVVAEMVDDGVWVVKSGRGDHNHDLSSSSSQDQSPVTNDTNTNNNTNTNTNTNIDSNTDINVNSNGTPTSECNRKRSPELTGTPETESVDFVYSGSTTPPPHKRARSLGVSPEEKHETPSPLSTKPKVETLNNFLTEISPSLTRKVEEALARVGVDNLEELWDFARAERGIEVLGECLMEERVGAVPWRLLKNGLVGGLA